MAVNMESLVARLEAVAARLEAQAGAPAPAKGTSTPSAASPGTVHPSVAAFDEILTGPLKALTTAAGTLNEPEIADATTLFADAFNAERRIIECIAACKKPTMDVLQQLLQPVGELMMKVGAKSEGKRTDAFNHLKALGEAVQCLSFVAYCGPDMGMSLPGPHVTETWQSAEFYANKILVQHRNTDGGEPHVTWTKALKTLVSESVQKVRQSPSHDGARVEPPGRRRGFLETGRRRRFIFRSRRCQASPAAAASPAAGVARAGSTPTAAAAAAGIPGSEQAQARG
jgi:adenylyl cyclase-associated protein